MFNADSVSLYSRDMEETSMNSSMLLMTIPTSGARSISPMTPSPSRELRGVRLFRAISRKLGRRSVEDLESYNCEDDSRSSSTDSCSSTSAGARCSRPKKSQKTLSCSSGGSGFLSPNHISSCSSDTGSESQNPGTSKHRHHSTTGASFRKVFQNLSLTNTRSQSCSSKDTKKKSKKSPPKRILRSPVSYTYVRGLSGLPTQRVPRTPPRIYTGQSGCGCVSNGYVSGLHR